MKRRTLIIACLSAGICFLLGFLLSYQLPKVKAWVLVQVERVSRDHLPVRILPSGIKISLFPAGASLQQVRILPKKELKDRLSPVLIDEIDMHISLFQLLQGRVKLKEIVFRRAQVIAQVPKQEKNNDKPLEGLFALVKQIPLQRLRFEDVNLSLSLAEPDLIADIQEINLLLENQRGSLAVDFSSPAIRVFQKSTKAHVRLDVETTVLLQPKGVTIKGLKVRRGISYVVASGLLHGDTEALAFDAYEFNARGAFKLDSMRNWAVKTLKDLPTIPTLDGTAQAEVKIKKPERLKPEVDFKVATDALRIDHYYVGQLTAAGSYRADRVTVPSLKVVGHSGSASLTGSEYRLQEGTFKSRLRTDSVELHELLKDLGVGELPVFLRFAGELPCEGVTKPAFDLKCTGSLEGRNLLVKADMETKSRIVAFNQFTATGELGVDAKAVRYRVDLAMPHSKGKSQGKIDYETGFNIDYEAFPLSLNDLTSLADLKMEGSFKLKGSTQGDSNAATMNMNLAATDYWLEDYWLGNATTQLSYKQGILGFKDLSGKLRGSSYQGNLSLNLKDSTIQVNGNAPDLDARDLLKCFERLVKLPFEVTGSGGVQVKAWGPLEFTALSYDLKSSLYKGTIAGEAYDQAHFDVHARKGEVATDRVQIVKNNGTINLAGNGHPNGQIKALIRGRNIRIEETNFLARSGLSLAGVLDFDMNLSDHVLRPDAELNGHLTKTSIGDQAIADSVFHLKFTANTVEGGGNFLNDLIKAEFVIPLHDKAPFSLKAETTDWNYAPLFAVVAGPAARKDFEGQLTSKISLQSSSGGPWNSSGSIEIPKFVLRRGNSVISAPRKLALAMNQGQMKIDNFYLEGENTFLRVTDSPNPANKLDVQVNGKLDLGLMALMTPFFEDLRGILSFAFNLQGGPGKLNMLGSAYVDHGFLKSYEFPHPLEEIRADLLFNQNKVLLNSFSANLGGGRLSGDGTIEVKGYKNVPVRVNAQAERVTLNIPEGFRTTGSGRLTFSGTWFPFLLKGNYDVSDGAITKEFTEDESKPGVRRNAFLPRVMLESDFAPLILDLQINIPQGVTVKNSMVEGAATGQINVKGDPAKPAILGTVRSEKDTRVSFRDVAFDVTSANIQFLTPEEINPKLYVVARTRVGDYDVNLVVQGTAAKPQLNLSSDPPLGEQDIISLLALGLTSEQLDTDVKSNQQAATSSYQIGTAIISKNPIGKEIKERFGLDLQVSSGFDDSNTLAVTKITVGRQFSPKFGVSGSRSVGQESKTEAKVKYRFNNKLSLVGSWEGRDFEEGSSQVDSTKQNTDLFGLDLEYKFEFNLNKK